MDFAIPRYHVVGFICALIFLTAATLYGRGQLDIGLQDLIVWTAISLCAGLLSYTHLIPGLIELNKKAGVTGKDLYKKGTPEFDEPIAESLGLAVAVAYLGALLVLSGYFKLVGREHWQAVLSEGLSYITLATFLGFVDDMLELRWRDKLIYPFFFSIVVVLNYQGDYSVRFPPAVQAALRLEALPLGPLFLLYLVCLSIFCVNSINIYAGVSGLESGQSLLVGLTLMLENLACIAEGEERAANLKSLLVLGPFCAVSLPLFAFNKVEKKTFVGDTYVYFAGCVIAYAAMVGRYPVKVLFFLLPQILNFLLSLPQLVGVVHCPRHRLPEPVAEGKLRAKFPENLNNINFVLWLTGPMTEKKLSGLLIFAQAAVNLTTLAVCRLWMRFPSSPVRAV